MKVISIIQPWATLVVIGAKKIETRSYNTSHRGPLLIHASKRKIKLQEGMYDLISEMEKIPGFTENYKHLPYGAIIGKVDLKDTCQFPSNINDYEGVSPASGGFWEYNKKELAFGDFSAGRYGWLFSDPVSFDDHHYPVNGALGLWHFDPQICLQCGCTGDDACVHPNLGPCWWEDEYLCSHCHSKKHQKSNNAPCI